jgi:cation diffusion facilitator family transporter
VPPETPGKTGQRTVLAALGANLGIAVTKFVAFALTGSASMLAEAIHSVADSGNEALLLLGRTRSVRARTREHPFGFGRERYFYGFIVAVVLFTIGAAFSIYDGIHKIAQPQPIESPAVAFIVLALAMVMEVFSLRTAVGESNPARGEHGWLWFIRRSKAPELVAVLLEDTAAVVGLIFAAAGVGLTVITGSDVWDGVGSIAIGALLACVAVILAVEMKSLLIGESASADTERVIVAALEDGAEVERVIHLRTVHLSPENLLVAAKIAVRPAERAEVIAAGIDAAERRVREAVPIAHVIYLEPDLYQASRVDAGDPSMWAGSPGGAGPRSGASSQAGTTSHPDASPHPDAGPHPDTGPHPDASPCPDAGPHTDTGPHPDAGPHMNASPGTNPTPGTGATPLSRRSGEHGRG